MGKVICEGSYQVKESFEQLLAGKSIITQIDEQIVYNQLDLDENAITAAKENTEANQIDPALFEVYTGNLIDDPVIKETVGYEKYDVVVANILADVIIPLQAEVAPHLKKGGIFITSGIINTKEQAVKDAFALNQELEVIETAYQGEWVSIIARKK